MTDFSVNKASNAKAVKQSSGKKTEFSKLKSEYSALKNKISKSDFANAPVMLRTELNMLSELKRVASRDNLQSELSWIEKQEALVNAELEKTSSFEFSNAYYQPVVSFGKKEASEASEQTELFAELMELCKKTDGTFDENAELMLTALSKQDTGLLHVVDLLKRAKSES